MHHPTVVTSHDAGDPHVDPHIDPALQTIDAKDMQINLMGFMERKAAPFMSELWKLLISASKASNGIPPEFLERKKAEIRQKKALLSSASRMQRCL